MAVNETITAFNLMQGTLRQISNPSTDTLFSNRINNILVSFSDDNVLIQYQRLQDKNQKLQIWIDICMQAK